MSTQFSAELSLPFHLKLVSMEIARNKNCAYCQRQEHNACRDRSRCRVKHTLEQMQTQHAHTCTCKRHCYYQSVNIKAQTQLLDTIIISCLNNNKTGLTVQIFEGNSIAPLKYGGLLPPHMNIKGIVHPKM